MAIRPYTAEMLRPYNILQGFSDY